MNDKKCLEEKMMSDFFVDLKNEMDQLVGQINGRFSTPRWSPIRYIYGVINQVTMLISGYANVSIQHFYMF